MHATIASVLIHNAPSAMNAYEICEQFGYTHGWEIEMVQVMASCHYLWIFGFVDRVSGNYRANEKTSSLFDMKVTT